MLFSNGKNKKFVTVFKASIFALAVFFFSNIFLLHTAHALVEICVGGPELTGRVLADGSCEKVSAVTTPENKTPPTTDTGNANDKSGVNDMGAQFGYWLAQIIYIFTVGFSSVVLAAASLILNTVIRISLDSAIYGLDFISQGWTMLRDLANMAFIFILVYIAIKVMFEAHTAGTMERLIKVLAVALIINFSFFATRMVIDAGNLLSVQFYNAIVSTTGGQTAAQSLPGGSFVPNAPATDITAKIMAGINFAETFKPEKFNPAGGGDFFSNFVTSLITFSFIYICLGVAMSVLAAAFIAAAVKFVVRIVMLWIAIVTSPIALLSWSFQGGHGHGGGHGHSYWETWRGDLIKYSFYPALFLFILLLISNFMGSSGLAGLGSDNLSGAQVGSWNSVIPAIVNIAVRMTFVLAMLYYALKADDYFKNFVGSSVAKSWGNNIGFGLPALLQRQTTGRAGAFLANRLPKEGAGVLLAPLRGIGGLASKSSFDVRSARVPYAKKIGLDIGLEKQSDKLGFGKPGGKGGWIGDQERRGKKLAENADHHQEGATAAALEQIKFVQEYGTKRFGEEVHHLRDEIVQFKKKQLELGQKQLKTMSETQRADHKKEVERVEQEVKSAENRLKFLTEFGKRVVDSRNAEHKAHAVDKFMTSASLAKHIAAKRITMTKEEKKEEKEREKEHADEHKGGDHGGGKGGAKGGGDHH